MRNVKEAPPARSGLFGLLPNLPNLFQSQQARPNQEQAAAPTASNKRSGGPGNVPLHRTAPKTNPLVDHHFPQNIDASNAGSELDGGFPHGPREISLLSRQTRSVEEMGVHFGYQVLSQQDLAFRLQNPEEKEGVMIFQVKI